MIELALPIGQGYGWGTAGFYIAHELGKLTAVKMVDPNTSGSTDNPVLHGLQGHTFQSITPQYWSTTKNVGYCFIEDHESAAQYVDAANRYSAICVGSKWAKDKLDEIVAVPVHVVHQGVDVTLFHPLPNKPDSKTFRVFSGGKIEYRKGHDLVIAAMREFMRMHADVTLVTSWANLWPQCMSTMEKSPYIDFVLGSDWLATSIATLLANEIPLDRVELHRMILDRTVMADIYRSCHVSLALSRCEAGTNLPLMESLACGIPSIAVRATGQSDVLNNWNSWAVLHTGKDLNGWVDPILSNAVKKLELAYEEWRAYGGFPVASFPKPTQEFTWRNTARKFMEVLR